MSRKNLSSKKKVLIEIRLEFKEEDLLEEIRDVLGKAGIFPNKLVEEKRNSVKALVFYLSTRSQAKRIEIQLDECFGTRVNVKVKKLKPEDWQTKWKKDYKPLKLTENYRMVPEACRRSSRKNRDSDIYIDTDLVFGSGTHPTTQQIAGFIDSKKGLFRDFLDIGTGTGILSILASKCGAERIWALDLSDEAIKNAQDNFRRNGCFVELLKKEDFKSFRRKRKFDFVAANLLTHDLIEFRDKILSYVQTGKYLAVSGVSICNYAFFRDKFDGEDIRCIRIKKSNQWCAILYKKL